MSQYLLRTQLAIEECEQHLTDYGAVGTPIESYLTQHILVVLCAEVQQEIYKIVDRKIQTNSSGAVATYISASQKKLLKGVKIDAISGFLGLFSSNVKETFSSALSVEDKTRYNDAIEDRHGVAHRQGASVSFDELKTTSAIAQKVLMAVQTAIQQI